MEPALGFALILFFWGSCLTMVGALGLAGVFSHK